MRQIVLTGNPVLASAVAAIATLDLSMVVNRLSAKGWGQERSDDAIAGYKSFLQGVCGGSALSPEPDVDAVWHEHILHTRQYARDCELIFGGFLHHEPDSAALHTASATTICVPSVAVEESVH